MTTYVKYSPSLGRPLNSYDQGLTSLALQSIGGGESLVMDGSGPDLALKNLTAGVAANLTSDTNTITIGATTSQNISVATGLDYIKTATSPTWELKGLSSGTGATVTGQTDDVLLAVDPPSLASSVSLSDTTPASGVYEGNLVSPLTVSPALRIRSFQFFQPNHLEFVDTGTHLTLQSPGRYHKVHFRYPEAIRVYNGTNVPMTTSNDCVVYTTSNMTVATDGNITYTPLTPVSYGTGETQRALLNIVCEVSSSGPIQLRLCDTYTTMYVRSGGKRTISLNMVTEADIDSGPTWQNLSVTTNGRDFTVYQLEYFFTTSPFSFT